MKMPKITDYQIIKSKKEQTFQQDYEAVYTDLANVIEEVYNSDYEQIFE